jgi:transposase
MALGHRPAEHQGELFVTSADLPRSAGHPFYDRLNRLLADHGFDAHAEDLCRPYYADGRGRPGIPPGVYFRMLFVGYFEGIDSQRGIAWRCADSLALRSFLGVPLTEATPDHSSLTRLRQRLPQAVHEAVFVWVLGLARAKKLLAGSAVGVDATTLEANAAMKAIVRKDTGEDYKDYLKRLAQEAGMEDPTDEDLRRFDKGRPGKTCPNAEWQSPTDPDARITQVKDGRTRLAYKAEHVVQLKSELVLGVRVHPADQGDAVTLVDAVVLAEQHLRAAGSDLEIDEAAADKGYHKASELDVAAALGVRTYVPEPRRQKKRRRGAGRGLTAAERRAVRLNRRRVRGRHGRRLQRLRSERVERSFAHVCDTGGARRTWLRGFVNVTKRYLVHVAAHNLAVVLRALFGAGKPRCLQGRGGLCAAVLAVMAWLAAQARLGAAAQWAGGLTALAVAPPYPPARIA